MSAILDQIARTKYSFKPRSVLEFFAIQLARSLSDIDNLREYLRLTSAFTPHVLAAAFRQIGGNGLLVAAPLERLRQRLELGVGGGQNPAEPILAFKAERRFITLAVFAGFQLRHTEIRQLSSDVELARRSTIGFVRWALEMYPGCSCALETYPTDDTRRILITAVIDAGIREYASPIWHVQAAELLEAFGVPRVSTRQEIRAVGERFWPQLPPRGENASRLDAAALGLYAHVRRLLHQKGGLPDHEA